MKRYLFIIFVTLATNIQAQITLEYDYDSASTQASGNPALADQLELVKFEISGERYVKINRHGKKICIYGLNHSLLKTIDYSNFPQASTANNYAIFLYFSESLFDTDSGMEFMYQANYSSPYTGIFNDDGSLIFSDSGAAIILATFPSQQYPIYNTTQGTKMVLSYGNGHAKVFSLPGVLSMAIKETNGQQSQSGRLSNLYPNPSNGKVTLQYQLPEGEHNGEIILYNTQGGEVKRYKVDDTFKDLLLDNTQLHTGTYFYQLITTNGSVGVKKMIIVK